MLHDPWKVTETYVNELDVVLLDVIQNFVGVREHPSSKTADSLPHESERAGK
jgi:hypothetical protein